MVRNRRRHDPRRPPSKATPQPDRSAPGCSARDSAFDAPGSAQRTPSPALGTNPTRAPPLAQARRSPARAARADAVIAPGPACLHSCSTRRQTQPHPNPHLRREPVDVLAQRAHQQSPSVAADPHRGQRAGAPCACYRHVASSTVSAVMRAYVNRRTRGTSPASNASTQSCQFRSGTRGGGTIRSCHVPVLR